MKSIEEIFRGNLIRYRGSRTQAEIAEAAGIPKRSYENVEINGVIPQKPNRMAIARALGVSEVDLFQDPSRAGKISPDEVLHIITEALRKPTPLAEHPIITAKDLPAGIAADWVRDLVTALSGDPAMKSAVDGLLSARKRRPKQSEDLG